MSKTNNGSPNPLSVVYAVKVPLGSMVRSSFSPSFPQLVILALVEHQTRSVHDLLTATSRTIANRPAAMHQLITRMVELGMVKSENRSKGITRERHVWITPKGASTLHRAIRILTEPDTAR